MNIDGSVRVDLSHLVVNGLLQVTESAVFDIWSAVSDPRFACELHIGDAVEVAWTPRLIEALQDAAHVRVTGSNGRGVSSAIRGLERLMARGAA